MTPPSQKTSELDALLSRVNEKLGLLSTGGKTPYTVKSTPTYTRCYPTPQPLHFDSTILRQGSPHKFTPRHTSSGHQKTSLNDLHVRLQALGAKAASLTTPSAKEDFSIPASRPEPPSHEQLRAACEEKDSKIQKLQEALYQIQEERDAICDKANAAERTLAHEQETRRRHAERAAQSSESEDALTTQIASMASQLASAHKDNSALRQEISQNQRLLEAERQARLAECDSLNAEVASITQKHQQAVHDNELYKTRVEQLEASQQPLRMALANQDSLIASKLREIEDLSALRDGLHAHNMQLQSQLLQARSEVANLNDSLTRSAASANAPSPLRSLLDDLKMDLCNKETALIGATEALVTERRRAAELQRQALDAAAEVEELHRDAGDVYSLRASFESAQAEVSHLKRRCRELEEQVMEARTGAMQKELEEAWNIAAEARAEMEAKEVQLLSLQGEVQLLRSGAGLGPTDAESWLMNDS